MTKDCSLNYEFSTYMKISSSEHVVYIICFCFDIQNNFSSLFTKGFKLCLKISLKCNVEKIISNFISFFSVESRNSRSSSQGSSRKSEDRLTEAEEADGEDADSQEDVSIFEDDFHQKVFAKSPISFKGRCNSKLRISLKNTVDQPSSVDDPKSPKHHKSQPNPVCLNF